FADAADAIDPTRQIIRQVDEVIDPGHLVGNQDGAAAQRRHRQDVAARAVAHHDEMLRRHAAPRQNVAIDLRRLVGHYLYPRDVTADARPGHLVLLVEQIAFGDE